MKEGTPRYKIQMKDLIPCVGIFTYHNRNYTIPIGTDNPQPRESQNVFRANRRLFALGGYHLLCAGVTLNLLFQGLEKLIL